MPRWRRAWPRPKPATRRSGSATRTRPMRLSRSALARNRVARGAVGVAGGRGSDGEGHDRRDGRRCRSSRGCVFQAPRRRVAPGGDRSGSITVFMMGRRCGSDICSHGRPPAYRRPRPARTVDGRRVRGVLPRLARRSRPSYSTGDHVGDVAAQHHPHVCADARRRPAGGPGALPPRYRPHFAVQAGTGWPPLLIVGFFATNSLEAMLGAGAFRWLAGSRRASTRSGA